MINYNISSSVNNRPNYDIGLTVDPALGSQARDAYGYLRSPGGGGWQGGSSGGWSSGPGEGSAGATTQAVNQNQLMSHQMGNLLRSDSPYLQRARREGEAFGSRRGLMNSAITGGASMGAAIDRAAPIAQFDAGRYGSVADQNMAAENQAALTNAQIAGQLRASGTSAAASMYNADAQRAAALDQMYLGHQFGAIDDYRRHMLGMETREDTQDWNAGQADTDRFLAEQQFWGHYSPLQWSQFGEGQRQFDGQLGEGARQFDSQFGEGQRQFWGQFGEGQRQFDSQFGEDQSRFWQHHAPLEAAQFDEGRNQFWGQFGEDQARFWDHQAPLQWWQLDQDQQGINMGQQQLNAQIYQGQFNPLFSGLSSIYTNPNLSPEQMNLAATNMMNMYPGFVSQAWHSIPPGLINPGAVDAAQQLPPVPPIQIGPSP